MSGTKLIVEDQQTLAASTTKTLLQLVTATNHPIVIVGYGISFNSVAAADPAVAVRPQIQTTAGTSSDYSASIRRRDRLQAGTLDVTVRNAFTVEPSKTDDYPTVFIPAQSGYEVWWPEEGWITLAAGERLGLEMISGALDVSIQAAGYLAFDE
jgi:hypothetical protein